MMSLQNTNQFPWNKVNPVSYSRDCGILDPCSPAYKPCVRAVRWLAEQCEIFFGDPTHYPVDRFIKDIMIGKIAPNCDGFVPLGPHADRQGCPGVWLEEKAAAMIRDVQREYDLKNDSKYFGQFSTPCGLTMDGVRTRFFNDCYNDYAIPRLKANTTECVPVPSSEHVAEIVGKKGGKIKNIRAETNTYIKTPKRDEEPVFVITGRKEDVAAAKKKILSAADHFSQLREARRQNTVGPAPVVGPPRRDGDVTVSVEVPYEFVGLVVGQKGATIKRIQQETNTYITTPSRRHRPIFEVVGQPAEVERAREAIQVHINSRVERFRSDSAAPPPAGVAPTVGAGSASLFCPPPDSSALLAALGDNIFAPAARSPGGLNFSSSESWSLPPPPIHSEFQPRLSPPQRVQPLTGSGSGRLPPFHALESAVSELASGLRQLGLAASDPATPSPWLTDVRGRTASLPAAADPAFPAGAALERRNSDDQQSIGRVLFDFPSHLGWDYTADTSLALSADRRAPAQKLGSNETLNSDSGVETTTPPPLDGTAFGPIGSKRASPDCLNAGSD